MPDIFEFAKDDTERRINSRVHLRERHGKVEVFKDGELYAVFGENDREFRKATMIQLARLGAASFFRWIGRRWNATSFVPRKEVCALLWTTNRAPKVRGRQMTLPVWQLSRNT